MENITVIVTLEVLGKPAKNVMEALVSLVDKMGAEKGITIKNKKIHEPKSIPESPDLSTAFAEIEIECEELHNYFGIVFGYMPSHIEIIYPEKIIITNSELNALANQITQRLHSYDAIAKKMIIEKDMIQKKLMEVAPHLFEKPKQEKPKKQKKTIKKTTKPEKKAKSIKKKQKSETKKKPSLNEDEW